MHHRSDFDFVRKCLHEIFLFLKRLIIIHIVQDHTLDGSSVASTLEVLMVAILLC